LVTEKTNFRRHCGIHIHHRNSISLFHERQLTGKTTVAEHLNNHWATEVVVHNNIANGENPTSANNSAPKRGTQAQVPFLSMDRFNFKRLDTMYFFIRSSPTPNTSQKSAQDAFLNRGFLYPIRSRYRLCCSLCKHAYFPL
jgi:hypothetical protein